MTAIIIYVKSLLERHFCEISVKVFENKLTFTKKAALHKTIIMHRKPRQVLHDLFSTKQKNGWQMTFAAVATKIRLIKIRLP